MLNDWAFYFITDDKLTKKDPIQDTLAAIKGGAKVVQFRSKLSDGTVLYEKAMQMRTITKEAGVDLIINDRVDIALAVNADGVHLGPEDLPCSVARLLFPDGIIGVSVGSAEEAQQAIYDGASYLAAGAIYDTTTKADAGAGVGPGLVEEIRSITDMHLTTIGGITLNNLPNVLAAGADSACAISATVAADDVTAAVKDFEEAIRSGRRVK